MKNFIMFILLLPGYSFASYNHSFLFYGDDIQSCIDFSEEVGNRLQNKFKNTVKSFTCLPESKNTFQVNLKLERKILHTTSHFVKYGAFSRSFFETKEECHSKAEKEIEIFLTETGTDYLFHFCFQENKTQKKSWGIRIDGLGKKYKSSYSYGFITMGKIIDGSIEDIKDKINEIYLESYQTQLNHIKTEDFDEGKVISFQYFSTERRPIYQYYFARFATAQQCRKELSEYSSLLVENDNQSQAFHYCSKLGNQYIASSIVAGKVRRRTKHDEIKFSDFQDCKKSVLPIVKEYQKTPYLKVIGGYCSLSIHQLWNVYIIFEVHKT